MTANSNSLAVTPTEHAPGHPGWPGVRTFRSARFRIVVAASIWLISAALHGVILARQAADPAGQYAFDFQTYHAAAIDVAASRSPYAAEMFDGPIPAQGAFGASLYKYPPLFAQALVPLAGLPLSVAAAAWLAAQAAMLLGAVWIALLAGGVRRNVEAFCWSGVAVTLFLPAFDTLWKGNVSGALALFVGLALAGGVSGGLAVAAAALLKTTPLVLVAPAMARGGGILRGLLVALAVMAISVILAPAAWLDFVRVLPNLVAGPSLYATNLAPHSVTALLLPSVPLLADAVRVLAVGGGAAAILGAVVLARHREGWPAAVALGVVALLLLPSATWYHYLAVLLPVAAFAWPRAGIRARTTLLVGAGAISAALLWLPLALVGALLLAVGALHALWPRATNDAPWRGFGVRLDAIASGLRAGADRVRAVIWSPAVSRRVPLYLSLLGYGLGIMVAVLLIRQDGGYGYDAHAYWLAGQNALAGQPLYWPHDEGTLGAFRYPPLFAQLWAPFTLLPGLVFSWLWRIVCFVSLRYLAGSWRNVGLWLLVPLVWTELSVANVTFPVAALCLMALRGQASGVAWAGALKFGPLLLMPYLWLRRREARRSLLVGVAVLAAAVAVSFALAPDAWLMYVRALGWMSVSGTDSYGVIGLFGRGVLDAAVNVGIGVLLVAAALYRGSDRLAYAATVIAVPVMAWWRLTPLLALPRLGRARR